MIRELRILGLLCGLVAMESVFCCRALGCTSAIVGRDAALQGRTMLWKHRDSGHPDNFVGRVEATDSTMAYVALFNGGDTAMAEAWAGFNSAGFAVMNTASYNLAPDTASVKDCEGLVMSGALQRCRTVADFEAFLRRKMSEGPLGVQANFGVTDATGEGAYFETTDYGFVRYSLAGAPDGVLIRSNYSYSGSIEGRLGTVRHDNAVCLTERLRGEKGLVPETFTEELSRSFYHHGLGKDMARQGYRLLTDRGEYIPRRSSCASVVIEGALPSEDASRATVMWVAIGFPAASHVEAVTLDSIPPGLLPSAPGGRSRLCDDVNRRRAKAFPRKGKEGKWLIDMRYLQQVMPAQCRLSEQKYSEGRRRREQVAGVDTER